jgi:hypothetical protein
MVRETYKGFGREEETTATSQNARKHSPLAAISCELAKTRPNACKRRVTPAYACGLAVGKRGWAEWAGVSIAVPFVSARVCRRSRTLRRENRHSVRLRPESPALTHVRAMRRRHPPALRVQRHLLAGRRERPRHLQSALLAEDEPHLARRAQAVGVRGAERGARTAVGDCTQQVLVKEAVLAARLLSCSCAPVGHS